MTRRTSKKKITLKQAKVLRKYRGSRRSRTTNRTRKVGGRHGGFDFRFWKKSTPSTGFRTPRSGSVDFDDRRDSFPAYESTERTNEGEEELQARLLHRMQESERRLEELDRIGRSQWTNREADEAERLYEFLMRMNGHGEGSIGDVATIL